MNATISLPNWRTPKSEVFSIGLEKVSIPAWMLLQGSYLDESANGEVVCSIHLREGIFLIGKGPAYMGCHPV